MKVERICRINKVLSTVNEYSKVENLPYKYQVLFMNSHLYGSYSLNEKQKENKNNVVIKPISNKNVLIDFSNNTKCILYDEYLQLYDISYTPSTFDVYC